MATKAKQICNIGNFEAKQNFKASVSIPIRVSRTTKTKLDQLLKQANKDRIGKKVKFVDILEYSVGLIRDEHLQEVCDKTLSNKDRMELLYRQAVKTNRHLKKDDFLGMLLDRIRLQQEH